MVLENTLESPLDCKGIQPVHPRGDWSWVFIGRTDVEAETPVFGHLMWRADSLEKTLMLGKIEGRRRRGWQRMRWLDGMIYSMDMSLGFGDGQGGLACCGSWGHRESDTTECLNWTQLFFQEANVLLISWLQSPSAVIFGANKIKSVTVSLVSQSTSHEVMGPDAMILVFWMLSFKPAFLYPLWFLSRGSSVSLWFLP